MANARPSVAWLLALASAAALVAGASAEQVASAVSQAVVTPDNPIFAAQDAPAPPPAPQTPAAPAPAEADEGAAQLPVVTGRGRGGFGQPRPYNQVVTSDARTDEGVFKVHRVGDLVYYEIPKSELGKDFLWVTQIKRTTMGAGYGGQAVSERVVRWEQSGNRLFLKTVNYDMVADAATPIASAVADANVPAIVRSFNVAAVSRAGDPVIDVTLLFLTEVPEFSVRRNLGARGMDPSRTFIEKVVSFPQNVNVQVAQTYTAPVEQTVGGRAGMQGASGTVVVFHSMVKLPETPMTPRLFDRRVGFFSTSMYDFGRNENKAVERTYITRYRLEKKDPNAAVSEPVKPIVYYIDPATPAKFVPWVKKGIEDWQPAFEAAGFRKAIVAKDAPTRAEDPDWDPEDARYSVVRWLPSRVEDAYGPHIHDPRSGEILEADIQLYHNIQNLVGMWYFTQVGALDPRARTLPLPDDLMGRLVQFVVAHEIGHTLGFQHNFKASSLYTLTQVRDKEWVKTNSHTPTLMDYARFNYVAQPEDGIAVEDLVPKVGPYDTWATMWGYKPIPGAATPDAERATLDKWAHEQDAKPYLRFTTPGTFGIDPGEQAEAIGDADAIQATALGLKNLERVSGMLLGAAVRSGESYEDLAEVYSRLVGQWRLELGHVANVIGGVETKELYAGQPGVRFAAIPRVKQIAAVRFLLERGLTTPAFLVNTDILRRIEPTGVVNRLRIVQTSLMNSMLLGSRLDRMVEQAVLDRTAYTPLQYLADVRAGVWRELGTPARTTDVYRRNVQRAYLDTIDNRLNGQLEPSDEVRALLRGELRALDRQLAAALPATTDAATRRHLQDSRDAIATILDPRAMRVRIAPAGGRGVLVQAGTSGTPGGIQANDRYDFDNDPFLATPDSCWIDFAIR